MKACSDDDAPRWRGYMSRMARVTMGKISATPNAATAIGSTAHGRAMLATHALEPTLPSAATPQQAKPMPTWRTPLMRPAARPETNAPRVMPPMVGMNSQPNWRSFNCSSSITKSGAEAMYRNNPAKVSELAAANRWKRGLRKMYT